MADEVPGWAWIVGGIALLFGVSATGYGIYEHNRANKEQKKRQDTEIDCQNRINKSLKRERDLETKLQIEIQRGSRLQKQVATLLGMYMEKNKNCSPEDIGTMREVFNVFANGGANIFATLGDFGNYLLSDDTIKHAMDICTAILQSPQLIKHSEKTESTQSLLAQVSDLKRRLGYRLSDQASQKETTKEWQHIVEQCKKGEPVQVIPSWQNKGGFVCRIGSYNAFLPNSQSDGSNVINVPIKVLLLSTDDNSRTAIISKKKLNNKPRFRAFVQEHPCGTMHQGKIVKILGDESHAVLVSMGGDDICGYLPRENVLNHPARLDSVFSIGQEINVYIQKTDIALQRISLSMYSPGQRKCPLQASVRIKK